jgi:hypothetical protein
VTSLERRKEIIALISWVTPLKRSRSCDGIKWSKVSLKHVHWVRDNPPEGIPDRLRCKNQAHWKFTYLKLDPRSSKGPRYFCWSHLMYSGLFGSDLEIKRTERWLERNADRIAEVVLR